MVTPGPAAGTKKHLHTASQATLQHSTLPVLSKNNGQGLGGELNTEHWCCIVSQFIMPT